MKGYQNLGMTAKIALPMAGVLIVALGLLAWQIQSRTSRAIEEVAGRELAALATANGNDVRDFLDMAINEAASLADGLEQTLREGIPLSREALVAMHKGIPLGNEGLFASGSMWEPNALDGLDSAYAETAGSDKHGRFLPYCPQGLPVSDLSNALDAPYYTEPKKTLRPYFSKPAPYTVDGQAIPMSTAAYPVIVDDKFRGVVLIDIALTELKTVIGQIKVYETGLASLFTGDGTIVAHSVEAMIGKNLFTDKLTQEEAGLRAAFGTGQPYVETIRNDAGTVLRYYQPIPIRGTGQTWYVALSVPMREVLVQATAISNITLVLCGLTLALLLIVTSLLIRAAVKPINYLAKTAEVIARGHLDEPIDDARFGGEVKTLSTALKKMIASLVEGIEKAEALSRDAQEESRKAQDAMRAAEEAGAEARDKTARMLEAADRLEQVASVVSSASTELSAQIEQSDHGATESAARLTEAATAMNEMNATVLEVAQNAGAAADASSSTKQKAEEGAKVVSQAVDSIRSVQRQSVALKGDMAKLSENAQSITRIMSVISDIADQTNLLALNAAIEAARAGDAGRGFAVVADEVRNLAEKTMASTTDVGDAIKAIQDSVKESTAGMDNAVNLIDGATEYANKSGEALQAIVQMVDNTEDQVRAIAAASEEQSAASEEINQSISQVNAVVGQTAQAMGEAARAVSDLAAQAQQLAGLIEDMKKD